MRQKLYLHAVLLCVLVFSSFFIISCDQKPANDQKSATDQQSKYSGRNISMDFQDSDIRDVMEVISGISKMQIKVDDNVTQKVSLHVVDKPWDETLDVILDIYKLEKVQEGNAIRVKNK